MVFLPSDRGSRAACEHLFEKVVRDEGQRVLGWRDVPVDSRMLGPTARRVAAGHPPDLHRARPTRRSPSDDAFERKLYVIRRRARHAVRRLEIPEKASFYIPSLSSPDDRLQGDAQLRPAAGVLSRPAGRAGRVGAGAGPLALLDQHLPQLVARASLPDDRAQRRDQHAARQRQLDARAREHVRVEAVRRRPQEVHPGHRHRRAATRGCSTTCSSCWCSRGGRCRTR